MVDTQLSKRTLPRLIIRADTNTRIGTGHVMRCLALAQTWQDAGGHAIFLMAMEAPALEARLSSEGIEVVHLSARPGSTDDAMQTAELAQRMSAPWIVVDGYHFGADYQRVIKDSGLRLLFIDDNGHADHYYADIVLNQNIHAHEGLYVNREPCTRLLLGTRYVLLRREFLKWREWKREMPEVARKVLVTLGGGDPDNVTLKVIQALQQIEVEGLETVIVAGGSNPHYGQLKSAVQDSRFLIGLERNVANMPGLMAWADMAVSAGGSTSWELAFMGLPNLVLVLAHNQRPIAERLDRAGAAVSLGWHESLSPAKIAPAITQLLMAAGARAKMSRRGPELVDGDGVNRVLIYMGNETLRFRQVREDDCRLLWEWANDPIVRAASFSAEPILWEQHVQWFTSKVSDPNYIFLIAMNNEGIPIGQVRYDIEGNEAVISVSINQKFRGKGYGSTIIRLGSQKLFDLSATSVIHAYAKQDNEASIRAFVRAGYKDAGAAIIRGHQAVHLLLQKQSGDE